MKLKNLLLSSFSMIAFYGTSYASEQAHSAPHWTYEEAAEWGSIDGSFNACEEGKAQSPIDIKENVVADLPSINFSYKPFSPKIINNGHTIQVAVPAGQNIKVGDETYELLQFHFHTPSEYHIDSESYPLELHFVHKNKDGVLAVVGVMIAEGKANAELEKIWENMPSEAGAEKEADMKINAAKLLPANKLYYRFMGSLTTPPCSEGVNWHMMEKSITASKEQIEKFRSIYAMNARPLQPANNRLIVKDNK